MFRDAEGLGCVGGERMKQYESGTKPRFDSKGSLFGDLHRELPSGITMFDTDSLLIMSRYDFLNTENRRFYEYKYVADKIYFTAIFETKYCYTEKTRVNIFDLNISVNQALLEMAKQLKSRLFFVVGSHGVKPLDFHEIDANGNSSLVYTLDWLDDNFNRKENTVLCWKTLGLIS